MEVTSAPLAGILIIQPNVVQDNRGYFYEGFQKERYQAFGIPDFVQDNVSRSMRNVIRGLHYQSPHGQGKLVGVTQGSVWDVVVDVRVNSPTFAQWFGIVLSDENHTQMYIPPGFAHGFCVTSNVADFYYKCTDYYSPASEHGIIWNDATLNIPWPVMSPILSRKDELYRPLHEIPNNELFI